MISAILVGAGCSSAKAAIETPEIAASVDTLSVGRTILLKAPGGPVDAMNGAENFN